LRDEEAELLFALLPSWNEEPYIKDEEEIADDMFLDRLRADDKEKEYDYLLSLVSNLGDKKHTINSFIKGRELKAKRPGSKEVQALLKSLKRKGAVKEVEGKWTVTPAFISAWTCLSAWLLYGNSKGFPEKKLRFFHGA